MMYGFDVLPIGNKIKIDKHSLKFMFKCKRPHNE